jgi:protoporphyrinogen/coproporphyrinogen III oxidase
MFEKPIKIPVVIIGAGLTGLALAFYLQRKGIDFFLIEREGQPGGVIRTFREKGFTFEAGPNTGVLGTLEMMQLFKDLKAGCQLEVANPEAKRRLIWKQGRWHSLPASLKQAVTTPLFSFKDKLRILGEPFRAKGRDPMESVAALVKRRMGVSFLDYAVDPFISGIYAGNPDLLITRFALPKLYNLEQNYGSFIKGAIKKKLKEKGPKPSREVFSVKGGLQCLVNALADAAGRQRIICGVDNSVISPVNQHFEIMAEGPDVKMHIHSPVVVSTIGAHGLGALMPFIGNENLKGITSLDYARVVQVVLGFRQWTGTDINAFGGLVPSKEKRRILGVLFTSSFLSGRAPEGGALLNVFMGGARNPWYYDLTDKQILKIAEEEISEMMGLPNYSPDLVKVFRYPYAIPQYGADSALRIQAISQIQQNYPGLVLAGNLHEGIGMADRVAQAVHVADKIEDLLSILKKNA